MTRYRYRVSEGELLVYRGQAEEHLKRAGATGTFVRFWLESFVWWPLRLLARMRLLYAHSTRPDGGPDNGNSGAGVGARLPVIPPTLSGAARKELP